MKKLTSSLFYAVLFIVFTQDTFYLAFADVKKVQKLPPLIFYLKGFGKVNDLIYTIDKVCNLGACPSGPNVIVPHRLNPPPRPYFLIKMYDIPQDINKYLSEKRKTLPGKTFQGKFFKPTSTITLVLNGIKKSTRDELSASAVEVSGVMNGEDGSNSVYLFLTASK